MVQAIQSTGAGINGLAGQEMKSKKTDAVDLRIQVDYKVSLQKESLTAITYNSAAKIETGDLNGVTDLRDLVVRLLQRQGVTWEAAMGGATVEVDAATQTEARQLIGEDGYWGVAQTSDRIFQLAVANAGNDPSKLDAIKAAVEKGFDMAKEALGGALPDISQQTYEAVMEKFDSWAAEASQQVENS